jgi:deoxyribose-phosphate aldolase
MLMVPIPDNFPTFFDHTLLRTCATEQDVIRLCAEAERFGMYSVCVNPLWVTTAVNHLKHAAVKVITVSGFPLGASRTDIKVAEAAAAVEDGAEEIDMVASIGLLISDRFVEAEADIRKVRANLSDHVALKVIIETALLTPERQIEAVKIIRNAGAQYVKTSTGFSGGATIDDVRRLRSVAGNALGVKASGGLRTLNDCLAMIEAGATRLGCSSSAKILASVNPS